jgi:hypothetical protein
LFFLQGWGRKELGLSKNEPRLYDAFPPVELVLELVGAAAGADAAGAAAGADEGALSPEPEAAAGFSAAAPAFEDSDPDSDDPSLLFDA